MKDGTFVYDFGQNASGIPEIIVSGAGNRTIRLMPGEVLNDDGSVNQEGSGGPIYFDYTGSVKGPETWRPSFTYYRYPKLFLHDVGLLGAMAGLNVRTIIEGDEIFTEFKGALTEQYVMQQMRLNSERFIGYWTNDRSTSEVDFVIQEEGEVIPIEVKSGENLKARSFKLFCEKYKPSNAIRASLTDYKEESWMTKVPLYGIGKMSLQIRI